MLEILGSPLPLFPSTGRLDCRSEAYRWRELNLEDWNAYLTLAGSWVISTPGREIECAPGTFALLPPRLARSYEIPASTAETTFYWMHFRPSRTLRADLPWLAAPRPVVWQTSDSALMRRLAETLDEMNQLNLRQPDRPHRGRIVSLLAESVVLRLASAAHAGHGDGRAPVDARIQRALEQIHRRLSDRHTLASLAARAGLSRSQFCARFREGLDRTPLAYVEERRLELGRHQLATTDRTVAEIAERLGFESPFYFSRRFRARFGRSPRAHRQETNGHGALPKNRG